MIYLIEFALINLDKNGFVFKGQHFFEERIRELLNRSGGVAAELFAAARAGAEVPGGSRCSVARAGPGPWGGRPPGMSGLMGAGGWVDV